MRGIPERLSILWIRKAYREEGWTPEELVEALITRNENYGEYNMWIVPPTREFVKPYLEKLKEKEKDLPLWGVPFAIKDNIDLAGVPTTAGCSDYAYIPEENATVVERLIEAGAIPLGKTNLDQFATGLVGTRSPYGECHNALDPEMISGGSSSGSAVSVALGIAAFSLGTDTAGSGRVPAMLNNLIGYKPPVGSWSTKGVVPACASLDCVTVFAGSLADAELVDSVARGYDEECPWSRELENRPSCLPGKVYLPLKTPEFYGQWAVEYEKKWDMAAARIRELGISVEYIDYKMFMDAALILYEGAYVAERWEDLKGFVESHPGSTFPVTETILRSGAGEEQTAAKLFGNLHELQAYKHKVFRMFQDAVMIMPTAGGSFTREEVRQDPIRTNSKMGLYTNHCNLLDMAAIAVPQDSRDRIRPLGITVFGRFDREDLVRGFAEAFLRSETELIAVCGLHKKGGALAWQLEELGAVYVESTRTSEGYELYRLPTDPVKPGMMKTGGKGNHIQVALYALPVENWGRFLARVKEPLVLGDITLDDGRVVKGFLCQGYAAENAENITERGYF